MSETAATEGRVRHERLRKRTGGHLSHPGVIEPAPTLLLVELPLDAQLGPVLADRAGAHRAVEVPTQRGVGRLDAADRGADVRL